MNCQPTVGLLYVFPSIVTGFNPHSPSLLSSHLSAFASGRTRHSHNYPPPNALALPFLIDIQHVYTHPHHPRINCIIGGSSLQPSPYPTAANTLAGNYRYLTVVGTLCIQLHVFYCFHLVTERIVTL